MVCSKYSYFLFGIHLLSKKTESKRKSFTVEWPTPHQDLDQWNPVCQCWSRTKGGTLCISPGPGLVTTNPMANGWYVTLLCFSVQRVGAGWGGGEWCPGASALPPPAQLQNPRGALWKPGATGRYSDPWHRQRGGDHGGLQPDGLGRERHGDWPADNITSLTHRKPISAILKYTWGIIVVRGDGFWLTATVYTSKLKLFICRH